MVITAPSLFARARRTAKRRTFDFSKLGRTSIYYASLRITGIGQRSLGSVLELRARDSEGSVYRCISGPKGIHIASPDGAVFKAGKAELRGIEAAVKRLRADGEDRPLYAAMLGRLRAELSPVQRCDRSDILVRHLWRFDCGRITPSVARYGERKVGQTRAVGGTLEMRIGSGQRQFALRWNAASGFTLERSGLVFRPGRDLLDGCRLALMRAMLRSGSRKPAQVRMLDALAAASDAGLRGEVLCPEMSLRGRFGTR